jgi:hypothetical protein
MGNIGFNMGKSWEIMGKSWENHGKRCGEGRFAGENHPTTFCLIRYNHDK